MTDLRLAIPAAGAWLAAGVLIGVPALAIPVAVASALIAGALLVLRRAHLIALVAIAVAVLSVVVAAHAAARTSPQLDEAARSSRFVSATATLSDLSGHAVVTHANDVAASAPVVIFGDIAGARIGSTIQLEGTVRTAASADGQAYLFYATSVHVVAAPPAYLGWADGLRAGLASAAAQFGGRGAELLPGLAIGDTSAVTGELDAAMKAASLTHLTAVSGSNCAVVVGLIVALGRALGVSRAIRLAFAGFALVAFVVLVTPQPSVVRAAVMAVIVLLTLASGRPVRGLPVLALAVLVMLLGDPWLARNYGFALSVLATGGLLLLANPLARVLGRWLPPPIALVVAVPLAAQLCCQPVLILLQPSLPTYGVIANVLAEPAAPVATVLGLIACLALPVIPWLGTAIAWVAWLPASWIAAVATFFSGLPFVGIPWPDGALGLALLSVVTVCGLVAVFSTGRAKAIGAAGAALLIIALVGSVAGARVGVLVDRPSDWQFAMCDVGQGDASIIRSTNHVAVIDTGPQPERLTACLSDLGIDHIDLLVLTHYDLDHVGGTAAVFGMVDTALVGPSSGLDDDLLVAQLTSNGARVTHASRGMTGTLGALDWTVLWPKARLSGIEPGNPASVTVTFMPTSGCACLSAIFLGDLGEQAQSLVLAAGPVPRVDVVKVAHHGSADQDPEFYSHISARIGLIGVGAENRYGHPTEVLLDILATVRTRAFRTDRSGLILVTPDSRVWTQRSASG